MNKKLEKLIPVFIIIYYLIVTPIVLYKYNIYLKKPTSNVWSQVEKYLINSKNYNNELIVFNPSWLKNYATDYGRFQKLNISKNNSNLDNYWLISIDKKYIPKNYQIVTSKEFKNLFIFKLKNNIQTK